MKKQLFPVLALLFSGCTTALWSPDYYYEKISGVYLDPFENIIYATGQEYAYVVPVSSDLAAVLKASREIPMFPSLESFELTRENQVMGTIELSVYLNHLTERQIEAVRSMGFVEDVFGLKFAEEVQGVRYLSIGEIETEKLEAEIPVGIALPATGAETAGKIALSPGAVAGDAAISVPVVILQVLIMSTDSL